MLITKIICLNIFNIWNAQWNLAKAKSYFISCFPNAFRKNGFTKFLDYWPAYKDCKTTVPAEIAAISNLNSQLDGTMHFNVCLSLWWLDLLNWPLFGPMESLQSLTCVYITLKETVQEISLENTGAKPQHLKRRSISRSTVQLFC